MEIAHKYFFDLANQNPNNMNEIMQFSKNFLNNTMPKKIMNLHGNESCGKSFLVRLLGQLHDENKIYYFSHNPYPFNNDLCMGLFENKNYVVFDNVDENLNMGLVKQIVSNEPIKMRRLYENEIMTTLNITCIIISINDNLFNQSTKSKIGSVKLTGKFSYDSKFFDYLLQYKNDIINFINNFNDIEIINDDYVFDITI